MNIGFSPAIRMEPFFPGEAPGPSITPKPEDLSLWAAAAGGAVLWQARSEGQRWGHWETLLLVDEAAWSQYDGVVDLIRKEGTLSDHAACVALTGAGFHGQRGRPWSVCPGNLHLVVHLSPNRSAGEIGHGFTLLPAVACVRAIRRLTGGAVAAGIKWINDVVVDRRKVGGFVVSTQIQGKIIRDAVLGIGINIGSVPEVEPTPFVPQVGCLGEFYQGIGLPSLLPALLREIDDLYGLLLREGFMPLLAEYRRHSVMIGRAVRIWQETAEGSAEYLRSVPPVAQGVVTAIADDLALILEGRRDPVTHGRVAEESACRQMGL